MNIDLFVAVLAGLGYFVFIYFTRKSKTFEHYSVADRSVGFYLLFASLSANFIGPGFTLGLTQKGFASGYFYLFIASAYGIGKIFEGMYLAPKIREKFTNAVSIGDVVAGYNSHNNKLLQFVVGLISFGLLIGLSVVMSKAAGEVLNNFLGVPKIIGTSVITVIVTSYSVFGGLKSTMMTDALQFVMFMILLPLLAIIVLLSNRFDLYQFVDSAQMLTQKGFSETSGMAIFGMILSWGLGEMLMPFTINTILAGRNKGIAKKALSYSGVLMIFWLFLMLSLGILSKIILTGVSNDDQVLLSLANKYYTSGLFGLFTVAIIGVIMSSQDALINCGSVVFVRDMVNIIKPLSESQEFKYSKIAGIIVGLFSIILASCIPSIIDGLLLFYGIWVPSVLVVTVFSIFIKKPSHVAAISALIVGALSSIIWNLTQYKDIIPNILIGICLSIPVYLIIHYKKKNN